MAKKVKRISINALEQAIAEHCEKIKTVEWNGLNIEIKKNIGFDEMYAFVDDISNACFDTKTGSYVPKRKEFLIRAAVVELYTNLSMPASVQKRYDLLYGTDLYDTILKNIDTEQLGDIIDAIDEGIEMVTNTGAAVLTKRMDDVVNNFEELEHKISEMFNGVDGKDIQNIMMAISRDGLDEEKLMQTFLESRKPVEQDVISAV